MTLDTIFSPVILDNISTDILKLHVKGKLEFEWHLNESYFKCHLKYFIKDEDKSNNLILNFTSANDQNSSRDLCFDLDRTILFHFQPNNIILNHVTINMESFGSHAMKTNFVLISRIVPSFNCGIINSRIKDITISGNFNNLSFKKVDSHNINIDGIFNSVNLFDIKSANSQNYTGSLRISNAVIDNLIIAKCHYFKEIILDESQFELCNLRSLKSTSLILNASDFNILNLSGATLEKLSLNMLVARNDALITMSENKIKLMYAENIRFGRENILLNLFFPINKLLPFKLMLKSKNIDKVEFNGVTWDYRSILDSDVGNRNKKSFILLAKNYYNSVQDIPEEKLFKSFEKLWHFRNGRKSLPLIFGYWSNSFGLSFIKPLSLIIMFIVLECLFIYLFATNDFRIVLSENWSLVTYILNPAHSSKIFTDLLDECKSCSSNYINFVPSLDNIFRIIIGYLIFQFIDAFRYKYNLGK